ncbi:protein JTB isoform X2 [Pseudomyrmex gracilis]|uniref:protein JTB isoform X2 n=1 Tax=Pseudomyrmex gracilis TaxID=219809 RepID=UPI000994E0E3|nr:protein JTB isoform X2 [Pseudomyrmex gracilis]
MIESCTKRRMLLGITFLGGFENTSSCISGDDYEIMSECHPCTAFEIASESIGVCVHARYKEVLKCKSGETITRSCDKVAWLEERTFWKFEAFMFALAVISCLSTYWRENILRHRMIKKIAKQLRISV